MSRLGTRQRRARQRTKAVLKRVQMAREAVDLLVNGSPLYHAAIRKLKKQMQFGSMYGMRVSQQEIDALPDDLKIYMKDWFKQMRSAGRVTP